MKHIIALSPVSYGFKWFYEQIGQEVDCKHEKNADREDVYCENW